VIGRYGRNQRPRARGGPFKFSAECATQGPVTELLERAVEILRGLPPETQDALAGVLLQWAENDPSIVWLTPGEEESSRASSLEPEPGEFATNDEIRAILGEPGSVRLRYGRRAAEELEQILSYILGLRRRVRFPLVRPPAR
jgi:hypothetical protein